MYTLKPIIVLAKYDYNADGLLQENADKTGFLPIIDMKPAAPENCDPICELTSEDEWTIGDHIRVNGRNASFALKLDRIDPAAAYAYRVSISSLWDGERDDLQRHPAEDGRAVYFLLSPKFKRRKEHGTWVYKSQGGWGMSVGTKYLHIEAPGEEPRTIRLCVFPTGLLDDDHEFILNELALLDRRLIMAQDSRFAASVGQRWQVSAGKLKEQLERMEVILRRLESAPERELVARRSRVPAHKAKKHTAKALMDQAAGRRLLRTDIHEESYNIYEHRMIRTYLENIIKLTGQYRELEKRERQALAGETISEQAVQDAKQRLNRQFGRLAAVDRELSIWNRQPDYLHLRVGLDKPWYRTVGGPEFQLKWNSVQNDWGNITRTQELAVNGFSADGNRVLFCQWGTRKYLDCLTMSAEGNGRQICFLCQCIDRLTRLWEERHTPFGVILEGIFAFEATNSRNYSGMTFKIGIRFLNYMEIRDNRNNLIESLYFQDNFAGLGDREELDSYLRDELTRFIENGVLMDTGEKLFYDIALCSRARFQHDTLHSDNDWDAIERQAARLLSSPLLRGVGSGERLHTSNLFAKHRNYRRAYRLMQEHQTQFAGIDLWHDPSLQVSATSSLYELWCLLKMLSIWIYDYSFTLLSPSKDELIDQLLQHLRDNKTTVSIVLEKRNGALAGMTLCLDYDKYRKFTENGTERQLRPDYFLTVCYKEKTWRFCMDAKYRNYSGQQQTKVQWYEDLFHVAWFKYIFRLRDDGEEINGSYILHSYDDACGKETGRNMMRYFWSRFDMAARNSDTSARDTGQRGILFNDWKKYSSDRTLDGLYKELGEIGDCRIGSVCFTPHNDAASDAAFRGLMQLIMEHFLGKDFREMFQSKCWHCGSEELRIEKLSTRANFLKYYVICDNCKEFWVQTHCYTADCHRRLGKHLHNYYREQSADSWNVKCPDCGAALFDS